jgi:hypothetical protein
MYVVIERFNCVGVMSSTPVRTFNAGKKVVAPNGEINAETETRKMIHIFDPRPQMVNGGSEGCRWSRCKCPLFSRCTSSAKSTGLAASSRAGSESRLVLLTATSFSSCSSSGRLFACVMIQMICFHSAVRPTAEITGTAWKYSIVAHSRCRLLKAALPRFAELVPAGGDSVHYLDIHLSPQAVNSDDYSWLQYAIPISKNLGPSRMTAVALETVPHGRVWTASCE